MHARHKGRTCFVGYWQLPDGPGLPKSPGAKHSTSAGLCGRPSELAAEKCGPPALNVRGPGTDVQAGGQSLDAGESVGKLPGVVLTTSRGIEIVDKGSKQGDNRVRTSSAGLSSFLFPGLLGPCPGGITARPGAGGGLLATFLAVQVDSQGWPTQVSKDTIQVQVLALPVVLRMLRHCQASHMLTCSSAWHMAGVLRILNQPRVAIRERGFVRVKSGHDESRTCHDYTDRWRQAFAWA